MFLFIQIVFGLIFSAYTILSLQFYEKNLTVGIPLSLLLLFTYYFTLYKASEKYKKKETGLAYLLVIGGFLILAFAQFFTCANSFALHMH